MVTGMECPRPAQLSEDSLQEIHRLEEKIGILLVGYEKIPLYKKLSSEELVSIQSFEKDTGSILVVYEG